MKTFSPFIIICIKEKTLLLSYSKPFVSHGEELDYLSRLDAIRSSNIYCKSYQPCFLLSSVNSTILRMVGSPPKIIADYKAKKNSRSHRDNLKIILL